MFYFVCVLQDVDCGWRGNQLRQEKQCNCEPVKLVNKMELRLVDERFFHVVPCVCSMCFLFCSTQKHSVLRTVIKNSRLKSVAIPAAASRGCLEISDKKPFLTQMVSHCFLFISQFCWIIILGMFFFRGHRALVTIWSWCADLLVTCQHDKHLQLSLSSRTFTFNHAATDFTFRFFSNEFSLNFSKFDEFSRCTFSGIVCEFYSLKYFFFPYLHSCIFRSSDLKKFSKYSSFLFFNWSEHERTRALIRGINEMIIRIKKKQPFRISESGRRSHLHRLTSGSMGAHMT